MVKIKGLIKGLAILILWIIDFKVALCQAAELFKLCLNISKSDKQIILPSVGVGVIKNK